MKHLDAAIRMANEAGGVLLATANAEGQPHVAFAGVIEKRGENAVVLREWFCPATSRNVQVNPHAAIVIQQEGKTGGFQLAGTVERAEQLAMVDGYAPDVEEAGAPQAEWQLVVRVDSILAFSQGPHSDVPV